MNNKKKIVEYIETLWQHEAVQGLTYDTIPVWWFFKRRLESGVFPLFTIQDLFKKRKVLVRSIFFLLRKIIYLNELLKIKMVHGLKKKHVPFSEKSRSRGRILFLISSEALISRQSGFPGYFLDRVEGLFRAFTKQKSLHPFLCVTDPFSKPVRFSLLKIPSLLYSFSDRCLHKKLRKEARRINDAWKKIKDELRSSPATKNYFLCLEPVLDFFFSFELLYLTLLHYETYKNLIRDYNLRIILVCGNGPVERAAIMAANNQKIPSIFYLHGFGFPIRKWDFPPHHSVLANGTLEKKLYIQSGAPPGAVFVIGPLFLFGELPYQRFKHIIKKISVSKKPSDKKRILLLTSPVEKDGVMSSGAYRSYLNQLIKKSLRLPDVKIFLKPHPLENNTETMYSDLGQYNLQLVDKRMSKHDFYQLLAEADLIISAFSTAIMETIFITETPLILLGDLYPENNINQHPHFASIPSVQGNKDFSNLVKRILFDNRFKKSLIYNRQKIRRLYRLEGDPVVFAVRSVRKIIKNATKKTSP